MTPLICRLCKRADSKKNMIYETVLPSGLRANLCAECLRDDPMLDQRLRAAEKIP